MLPDLHDRAEYWIEDSHTGGAPTSVAMVDDQNVITGQVGGPAEGIEARADDGEAEQFDDGYDDYTFTAPAGYTMDQVILVNYVPTAGNTSSGWNLYSGSTTGGTFIASPLLQVSAIGTNLPASIGPLAPGDYTVEIREFGTADNVYELNHQIPGLPVELQRITVE